MMKRATSCLLFVSVFCLSMTFGGVADDGFISTGEYDYGFITWRSGNPPLVVNGGGAGEISVRDNGHLIVQFTSTPLAPPWNERPGGIYDIKLYNTSQLLFLGGETELITIGSSATAELKGGNINLIKSMQFTETTGADPHIDLHCQLDSWSWIDDNPLLGIQGLWLDGTSFHIEFINDFDYDPVWTNINIIPEPTTLLLFGMGGLLIRRKR